jgi:hypothetical protein
MNLLILLLPFTAPTLVNAFKITNYEDTECTQPATYNIGGTITKLDGTCSSILNDNLSTGFRVINSDPQPGCQGQRSPHKPLKLTLTYSSSSLHYCIKRQLLRKLQGLILVD